LVYKIQHILCVSSLFMR